MFPILQTPPETLDAIFEEWFLAQSSETQARWNTLRQNPVFIFELYQALESLTSFYQRVLSRQIDDHPVAFDYSFHPDALALQVSLLKQSIQSHSPFLTAFEDVQALQSFVQQIRHALLHAPILTV